MSKEIFYPVFFIWWRVHWPYLVMQVNVLITCVWRANEKARDLISVVQFLIYIHIITARKNSFHPWSTYKHAHFGNNTCCLVDAFALLFMFLKFVRPATAAGDARNTGKEAAVATRINGNQIGISAYQKQAKNHQKSRLCGHLFT